MTVVPYEYVGSFVENEREVRRAVDETMKTRRVKARRASVTDPTERTERLRRIQTQLKAAVVRRSEQRLRARERVTA